MPLFAGIAGPSGAGKTTLARELLARLPGQATILSLDWYYNDTASLPMEEREAVNFDHPEALDWERFFEDFLRLESGTPAEAPIYDFCRHARLEETRTIEPRAIILVEGLHTLWQPALRAMLQFRIYVDASQSVCLKRRIERDVVERDRATAGIIRQYKEHTNPMYLRFVAPSREFADIVISGEQDFSEEADRLALRLQ